MADGSSLVSNPFNLNSSIYSQPDHREWCIFKRVSYFCNYLRLFFVHLCVKCLNIWTPVFIASVTPSHCVVLQLRTSSQQDSLKEAQISFVLRICQRFIFSLAVLLKLEFKIWTNTYFHLFCHWLCLFRAKREFLHASFSLKKKSTVYSFFLFGGTEEERGKIKKRVLS